MTTHLISGTALTVGLGTLVALGGAGRRPTLSAAALLAAAHSIDAEHWVRMVLVELIFAWRRRCGVAPADVLEAHRAVHMCWPIDLEQNAHMNNAKYAKLLNYTRRAFWLENGVWAACAHRSPPANMVVTAMALRYRRQIRCFERFLVVTRLLYWDQTDVYVEHIFESVADGFVLATCLVKYRPVSPSGRVAPSDLLEAATGYGTEAEVCLVAPPPTGELAAWIEYERQASHALHPQGPGEALVLVSS